MNRVFIVQVEMPRDVTVSEMRDYIEEAVSTWKGSLHPDEPLFDLKREMVKVVALPAPRNKK